MGDVDQEPPPKRQKRVAFAEPVAVDATEDSNTLFPDEEAIFRARELRRTRRQNIAEDAVSGDLNDATDGTVNAEASADTSGSTDDNGLKQDRDLGATNPELAGLKDGSSLSGVPIEPFHMRNEEQLGAFDESGYFVFRNRSRRVNETAGNEAGETDDEEEDDPWFKALSEAERRPEEGQNGGRIGTAAGPATIPIIDDLGDTSGSCREMIMELCGLLINDNETPAAALRRLKANATDSSVSKEPLRGVDADSEVDRKGQRERARMQRGNTSVKRLRMSAGDQMKFDRITELCDLLSERYDVYGALTSRREALLLDLHKQHPMETR